MGLDFAGPLYVGGNTHSQEEAIKAYICLFTCTSTRAIHLQLTQGLNAEAFLFAFRRFLSRRGLSATIVSDNAKTFKSTSSEVCAIARSPEVFHYLSKHRTTWNAKAPWWGVHGEECKTVFKKDYW